MSWSDYKTHKSYLDNFVSYHGILCRSNCQILGNFLNIYLGEWCDYKLLCGVWLMWLKSPMVFKMLRRRKKNALLLFVGCVLTVDILIHTVMHHTYYASVVKSEVESLQVPVYHYHHLAGKWGYLIFQCCNGITLNMQDHKPYPQ